MLLGVASGLAGGFIGRQPVTPADSLLTDDLPTEGLLAEDLPADGITFKRRDSIFQS
jgi:hypothetical protein